MPVQPTYPGVYVQEEPSGVRTITGVSTSTAVFIGRAKQGPLKEPVLCLSYPDFERAFSSAYTDSDLARAVRLFFLNGGTKCYVMRIAKGAESSEATLKNETGAHDVLKVIAKSPGLAGDVIHLAVTYNGPHPESTFNLEVFRLEPVNGGALVKKALENWTGLSMDPNSSRYVQTFINQHSALVEVEDVVSPPISAPNGYSQSGRILPSDLTAFWKVWRELLAGISAAKIDTASWTSTSVISTSGKYTGDKSKVFTFEITAGGTVGNDTVTIQYSDGESTLKTLDLSGYTSGEPITFSDESGILQVAFEGGKTLVENEIFTITVTPPANRFRLSADGGRVFRNISLAELVEKIYTLSGSFTIVTDLATAIENLLNDNFLSSSEKVEVEFPKIDNLTPPSGYRFQISATNGADIRIEPGLPLANDLAIPMMLGSDQGGIEVSGYAQYRPAPNGIVLNLSELNKFALLQQDAFNVVRINGTDIDTDLVTCASSDPMYKDAFSSSPTDHRDGLREKWGKIIEAFEQKRLNDPTFKWTAELWGSRLALLPLDGGAGYTGTITSSTKGSTAGKNIGSDFYNNVRYFRLAGGNDGQTPQLQQYRDAFEILRKEVDLFNLLILPRDEGHSADERKSLWGPASVFCQEERAFLLMDGLEAWDTVQKATNPSKGVNSLRPGLVKDHSAVFYPRLIIREDGLEKKVGPAGAIAGLMARIDANRGVWKAPAGTEADIRGIVGLEYRFSNQENGVLNPRGINTLRVFPNGIVNWGARTMDGDDDFTSEWKYIPVRRTALFIEESLYRGLKWVVFEPNDEPLWGQIRLNVGAFMHNLFRQGAFQGQKRDDAYFVKCDKETTTQNDIDLGIVHIWVGFAPLKPAEFVIIHLQQKAGQIQV